MIKEKKNNFGNFRKTITNQMTSLPFFFQFKCTAIDNIQIMGLLVMVTLDISVRYVECFCSFSADRKLSPVS